MFRQMLYTQWKWARVELFIVTLLAVAAPLVVVRLGLERLGGPTGMVLDISVVIGVLLIAIAVIAATMLAVRPYVVDAVRRHSYALSLPLAWPTFVLRRFLAGATLMLVPALGVWIGAAVASVSIEIPPTLRAYPGGVALRFTLSALTLYAMIFLIQYTGGRRAAKGVVIAVVAVIVAELGAAAVGLPSPTGATLHAVGSWPGPFELFSGRWMLFDV